MAAFRFKAVTTSLFKSASVSAIGVLLKLASSTGVSPASWSSSSSVTSVSWVAASGFLVLLAIAPRSSSSNSFNSSSSAS